MAIGTTVFPSLARLATVTSPDIDTSGFRHLIVTLDTTAFAAGSCVLSINGKDTASGKYRLILAGAAVVSVVTNTYKVTQGVVAAAANVSAVDVLPQYIQIVVTSNGSTQSF
jgi:hypothetical protein